MNIQNLSKLIAHLEAQPPERINMGTVSVRHYHTCGTAGCILGHAKLLWPEGGFAAVGVLDWDALDKLFEPDGYNEEDEYVGGLRYPARRVIATLKRLRDTYLATGNVVVDWGPEPSEEPKTPWVAPQVAEVITALPAEITNLLRPSLVKTEA